MLFHLCSSKVGSKNIKVPVRKDKDLYARFKMFVDCYQKNLENGWEETQFGYVTPIRRAGEFIGAHPSTFGVTSQGCISA